MSKGRFAFFVTVIHKANRPVVCTLSGEWFSNKSDPSPTIRCNAASILRTRKPPPPTPERHLNSSLWLFFSFLSLFIWQNKFNTMNVFQERVKKCAVINRFKLHVSYKLLHFKHNPTLRVRITVQICCCVLSSQPNRLHFHLWVMPVCHLRLRVYSYGGLRIVPPNTLPLIG